MKTIHSCTSVLWACVFKAYSVFLSLTHITKGWDWKNACRSVPASESSRYCGAWAIRYSINLASSISPPPHNDSKELILFLSTFNFQSKLVISFKLHPRHLMFSVGVSNHFKSRQLGKQISMCYHRVMGLAEQIGISWLFWYQKSSFVCFCVFWQLWEVLHLMIHQILRILLCKSFHCFPCVLLPLLYNHGSEHRMSLWCGCGLCWACIESWVWLLQGGWAACHVETCSPKLWALSL